MLKSSVQSLAPFVSLLFMTLLYRRNYQVAGSRDWPRIREL